MHKLRVLVALLGIWALCSGCMMKQSAKSKIFVRNNSAVDQQSISTFGWGNLWWAIDGDVLSIKGSSHNARDHKTYYVQIGTGSGLLPSRTHYFQEHHLLLQVQVGEHIPPEGAACDALIDLILEWKVRKHSRDSDHNFIPYEEEHMWLAHPSDLMRYRGKVKVYIDYVDEKISNNGRRRTHAYWRINLFDSEIARVGHADESIRVNGTLDVRHTDEVGIQNIDSQTKDALRRLSIADGRNPH